ncbi:toll/interleukin-1 receptor domain-containing protein [Candidatus Merdisoma sp. JLR.KK006]|uniref:toll/interleukin-1 receptor domain-containing protein n=1 Tax=Candidatus Merdisoma sp. JLR.KK006 TaxID=3112626 RepID=UPI002FF14F88
MKYQYDIALSFATENQDLVEKVYHYLRAEEITVFFAPSPECQRILSGRSQREVFYEIFALKAKYVALFVSEFYLGREVPMEEASIAFAKHGDRGSVIPVYLDGTVLPTYMFNPKNQNYFRSNNVVEIAVHLAEKIKSNKSNNEEGAMRCGKQESNVRIVGNRAQKQVFINELKGHIEL